MEVVFNLMQGIIIVAIEVFCCVFFFESFFYSRETKYTMWLKGKRKIASTCSKSSDVR